MQVESSPYRSMIWALLALLAASRVQAMAQYSQHNQHHRANSSWPGMHQQRPNFNANLATTKMPGSNANGWNQNWNRQPNSAVNNWQHNQTLRGGWPTNNNNQSHLYPRLPTQQYPQQPNGLNNWNQHNNNNNNHGNPNAKSPFNQWSGGFGNQQRPTLLPTTKQPANAGWPSNQNQNWNNWRPQNSTGSTGIRNPPSMGGWGSNNTPQNPNYWQNSRNSTAWGPVPGGQTGPATTRQPSNIGWNNANGGKQQGQSNDWSKWQNPQNTTNNWGNSGTGGQAQNPGTHWQNPQNPQISANANPWQSPQNPLNPQNPQNSGSTNHWQNPQNPQISGNANHWQNPQNPQGQHTANDWKNPQSPNLINPSVPSGQQQPNNNPWQSGQTNYNNNNNNRNSDSAPLAPLGGNAFNNNIGVNNPSGGVQFGSGGSGGTPLAPIGGPVNSPGSSPSGSVPLAGFGHPQQPSGSAGGAHIMGGAQPNPYYNLFN